MSGFIGSPQTGYISVPLDDYNSSFSNAGPINDQSVSIGNIILEDWEIPEKVTWGGSQRMTVHKLVGGTRYIDTMGPDNAEVSWSGKFLSQDASFRADQLDIIRKSGQVVDVVFAGRYYSGVVSQFTAQQITQFLLDYQVSITILADESAVSPPPDPPPLVAITNDIILATTMAIVAPEMLAAQVSAALIPPLLLPLAAIQIGTAATTAVAVAIGNTAALINGVQIRAETQMALLAASSVAAANLAGANSVVGAVVQMNQAADATLALASAVSMGAYINRSALNVANQA
jgi:hypothetical protein